MIFYYINISKHFIDLHLTCNRIDDFLRCSLRVGYEALKGNRNVRLQHALQT